jgi:hypothetical protein
VADERVERMFAQLLDELTDGGSDTGGPPATS